MRNRMAAVAGFVLVALAGGHVGAGPIPGVIAKGPIAIELSTVASGLVAPGLLLSAPDGTGRKFIVDQPGKIHLVDSAGTLLSTPFLDLSPTSATPRVVALSPGYDERGLLGVAFDPGFNNPLSAGYRRIFTYTSEAVSGTADYPQIAGTPNHHSVVASWRVSAVNPNVIDTSTRQELLRFDEPQSNHNGGHLAFGPDGLLYISTGDGGGANDTPTGHHPTTGNGQSTATPLGKMLRIDVNGTNSANGRYGIPAANPFASGTGGLKEIYAYGFRNPYRFSFDGNNLYAADVGQNTIEEVDKVEVGKNYGWRYKEGSYYFDPANPSVVSATPIAGVTPDPLPTLTDPVLQYDRDDNGTVKRIAIVGGFVYRGTRLPQLAGKYVFGDFSSSFGAADGSLYYGDLVTGEINQLQIGAADRALGMYVKGIGQDSDGELYLLASTAPGPSGSTGVALAIVAVPEPSSIVLLALVIPLLGRSRRAAA